MPRWSRRRKSAFFFALLHAGLDEKPQALSWLEKAYKERSGSIRYLKVEPRLDRLRGEPRFQELMRRVGLAGQP
ncbi:MAG: TPR end-of-group domain-containing protein [Vicinamibacterales bacterium]